MVSEVAASFLFSHTHIVSVTLHFICFQEGSFHSAIHMLLQHVPPHADNMSADGLSRSSTMDTLGGSNEEEANMLTGGGGKEREGLVLLFVYL